MVPTEPAERWLLRLAGVNGATLTVQLRQFVRVLASLRVHGDIWINRSYATKKPLHSAMNFPTEMPGLETELHRVLGMCEEDETALAKSTMPQVDGIFLASLNKLRHEFEKRLHRAKAERRHEVLGLNREAGS